MPLHNHLGAAVYVRACSATLLSVPEPRWLMCFWTIFLDLMYSSYLDAILFTLIGFSELHMRLRL
jgi:hypothetical protein